MWTTTHARIADVPALCKTMRKRRLVILSAVILFQLSLTVDVFRRPESQLSGKLYVAAVHAYQTVGRPLLKGVVACRFRPTCSDYSITSVQKHGTLPGLVLTCKRLISCTNDVPMGTPDPVAAVQITDEMNHHQSCNQDARRQQCLH